MLEGEATLEEVGQEIFDRVIGLASGEVSVSEALGHQEFILTYKTFEPIGPPACRCDGGGRGGGLCPPLRSPRDIWGQRMKQED